MQPKFFWVMIATVSILLAADSPYAGRWRLDSEKSTYPKAAKTIEFMPHGTDGLTIKIVDLGAVCETRLDGKDYPATGPTVPSGYTLAVRKIDARTFEMTQKLNGKTLYTSTFQASVDGKTLTETDSANMVGAKVSAVYDRQ